MDRKRGKVLVGAVVAVTMGAFAVPFCSNASAAPGTATPPQDRKLIQLAEEEHYELKEQTENKVNALGERAEDKAHELRNDAVAVPNAVHAEHEEHEAVEASSPEEHSGMRHEMKEKAESHVDEMGHEVKGAANSVTSEHEEHEAREMNDR